MSNLGDRTLKLSYPAERIDFDAVNIPTGVIGALEGAIICHANKSFIASAIMVRKTLEELCRERGATGGNLKEPIKALGTKAVLPTELLNGLEDLRLLGNDAAHIESKEYDKVGQEEIEVGIEFAKEVLKAVYQYSAPLNKLRASRERHEENLRESFKTHYRIFNREARPRGHFFCQSCSPSRTAAQRIASPDPSFSPSGTKILNVVIAINVSLGPESWCK